MRTVSAIAWNQFGDTFVSKLSGEDLPNVVFNADNRKRVAAYFAEIFSRLGNDWDFVRSPVHWQYTLAQANPLRLRVWGENTGHNNREAMRITFERIKRFNLMGLMWAFDSELFADPNPEGRATFTDYLKFIQADSEHH